LIVTKRMTIAPCEDKSEKLYVICLNCGFVHRGIFDVFALICDSLRPRLTGRAIAQVRLDPPCVTVWPSKHVGGEMYQVLDEFVNHPGWPNLGTKDLQRFDKALFGNR
jgi:hypothetical protein